MSDKKPEAILNHDEHTQALQGPFLKALKHRRAGKIEEAMDLLNEVLKSEPRLGSLIWSWRTSISRRSVSLWRKTPQGRA